MTTTPMTQYIEQMGLMFQADGSPRIAGQILGYLLIEGEPRTLAQMTESLRISKASASTNARLLEARGMVKRVSPMGMRQDAYEAVPEPDRQILRALADRFRRNADAIAETSAAFPEAQAAARARVEGFADFYRRSADFIEEWCDRMGATAGTEPTSKD